MDSFYIDIRDRLMVAVHKSIKEAERVYGDKFNNHYSVEFYRCKLCGEILTQVG